MKNSVILKTFIALILACIAGVLSGADTEIGGVPLVEIYGIIGDLFLNALTLMVVPLVASSIILGGSKLGGDHSAKSLGAKTFGYFGLTTVLAVLAGYFVVTAISPGTLEHPMITGDTDTQVKSLQTLSSHGGFFQFKQLLLKLVPSNILAAASQGQMLGLIFFCLLFGYFMVKVEKSASHIMVSFWNALFQIMMKVTHFVMKALPLGVFGLVAKVVATSGIEAFQSVAWFFLAVILALGIYAGLFLPFLLKVIGSCNPWKFYSALTPALLAAFSTSSSAAALPVVLDCMEKRVGVSNRICGFAVPLGTALSLSGSALYTCMVVFFVSQAYDTTLSFSAQFLVIAMSVMTSFGLAGIPSACLISVVVILQTIGLPAEGIALVLAVERILDMVRSAVNVLGNSCCTVLIAKSEGEVNLLTTPSVNPVTIS